jgi:hypothetical protein
LQYRVIKAGEKIEIDMVTDEIQNLHHQSRTDRGFYMADPNIGKSFPPHPVKIVGIPPAQSRPADDPGLQLAAKDAEIAALKARLAETKV